MTYDYKMVTYEEINKKKLFSKKKQNKHLSKRKMLFVGIPGYEPGMTGPESVVLPLHHNPISLQSQAYCFLIADAKVLVFFEPTKFFGTFF